MPPCADSRAHAGLQHHRILVPDHATANEFHISFHISFQSAPIGNSVHLDPVRDDQSSWVLRQLPVGKLARHIFTGATVLLGSKAGFTTRVIGRSSTLAHARTAPRLGRRSGPLPTLGSTTIVQTHHYAAATPSRNGLCSAATAWVIG